MFKNLDFGIPSLDNKADQKNLDADQKLKQGQRINIKGIGNAKITRLIRGNPNTRLPDRINVKQGRKKFRLRKLGGNEFNVERTDLKGQDQFIGRTTL